MEDPFGWSDDEVEQPVRAAPSAQTATTDTTADPFCYTSSDDSVHEDCDAGTDKSPRSRCSERRKLTSDELRWEDVKVSEAFRVEVQRSLHNLEQQIEIMLLQDALAESEEAEVKRETGQVLATMRQSVAAFGDWGTRADTQPHRKRKAIKLSQDHAAHRRLFACR